MKNVIDIFNQQLMVDEIENRTLTSEYKGRENIVTWKAVME
jgi:hypothetical protein